MQKTGLEPALPEDKKGRESAAAADSGGVDVDSGLCARAVAGKGRNDGGGGVQLLGGKERPQQQPSTGRDSLEPSRSRRGGKQQRYGSKDDRCALLQPRERAEQTGQRDSGVG